MPDLFLCCYVRSGPDHRDRGNNKDRILNIIWIRKRPPPRGMSCWRFNNLLNVISMADGNMLHTSLMLEWHEKMYGIVIENMVSDTRFNPEWRVKWIICNYIACVIMFRCVKSWNADLELWLSEMNHHKNQSFSTEWCYNAALMNLLSPWIILLHMAKQACISI